jgi:probable F420-dependent oxidoreductase
VVLVATRGMVIGGPYEVLGELAREVEARGFDSVWVAETGQDTIVQSTVALQATSSIDVGTNITLAFPRSPAVTAMSAWDLNGLSGERFVLGLGSQVRRIVEDHFSSAFDQPAKRMGEYVQAMQAVWRMSQGERATFEGELYRVLRPGVMGIGRATDRPMPRVHVAAVGPLMTRVAATYADGILGHPFTSERYLTDDVLPRIEQALSDAGRAREDFRVCQGVILCIADDREVAVREAKGQIAFYGTTPNYRGVFASHGDEWLTDHLRGVFKDTKRDYDALVAAVPDEAVERYAIAGTPDEVRDRLDAIERHVDHLILGGAWYGVGASRSAENLMAILETFEAR